MLRKMKIYLKYWLFWSTDWALQAPDVCIRIPWDGNDECMRRVRFTYELQQHNFNQSKLCQKKCGCIGCILGVYQALRGAPWALDAWFKVPLDGWDRLERRSGYRYDFKPNPHDLNHSELCWGKLSCVGCILSCLWALMGAPWAPNMWFRVPWDGSDILVRSKWYMYDFRPLPHFYNLKPCNQKNSCIRGILADFWALIKAS